MKPRILLATLALASALRPRHVAPLRCAQKALGAACAALALAGPALAGPAHAVDASERRPRPTSCASSARHAATAGPGRRSHAATMLKLIEAVKNSINAAGTTALLLLP